MISDWADDSVGRIRYDPQLGYATVEFVLSFDQALQPVFESASRVLVAEIAANCAV
jgi:hypothetical protein